MLKFSDDIKVHVVPRLEDSLIDDLFYQEEEIGEMRHSAFMIECGLEEDPPDGPDVPPVPWGDMLLKQQQQQHKLSGPRSERSDSSPTSTLPYPRSPPTRTLPGRTRSADDMEILEEEMSPRRTPPTRRGIVATKSGSVHAMRPRRGAKISPPAKSHSSDEVGLPDTHLSLSFAKTEPKSPLKRGGRKLVASKSGSLHGMQVAAAKAKQAGNGDDNGEEIESPSRLRKMVRCKSGTAHGMRKAAEAAMALRKSEEENGKAKEDLEAKPSEASPRRLRKIVRCKSGTSHGMRKAAEAAMTLTESLDKPPRPTIRRGTTKAAALSKSNGNNNDSPSKGDAHIVFKNGKRTVVSRSKSENHSAPITNSSSYDLPPRPCPRTTSSSSISEPRRGLTPRTSFSTASSSSTGDDDFLSEMVSDSEGISSDVSVSTVGSDEDDHGVFTSPSKGLSKTKISYQASPKVSKESKKNGTKKVKANRKETVVDSPPATKRSPTRIEALPPKPQRSAKSTAPTSTTPTTVSSAISKLRNGKCSPSELLASMQQNGATSSSPTKTTASSPRVRPKQVSGAVSKKVRSKSVGNPDIPPAFRNL